MSNCDRITILAGLAIEQHAAKVKHDLFHMARGMKQALTYQMQRRQEALRNERSQQGTSE